jgi:hypothetical protein
MPDTLAVLTGDIVRSSALAQSGLDAAMAAIAEAAGAAARWGDRSARLARFRGDGWQWVAPEPRLAMRAALVIRASLRAEGRAFDTRISIGIGPGSLPSDGELAAASGPAFQLSGRGLDEMGRSRRLALAWAVPPACAGERRALVALVDEIARRWTPAQARVLRAALQPEPPAQTELAAALGVAQQTVARHLRAAGAGALAGALDALEAGDR